MLQLPYHTRQDKRATARVRSAAIACALLFIVNLGAASQRPVTPAFAEVARAVESHFAAAKDYRDGDLIYRSQIAAALVAVKAAGWDVAAAQDIVALGLADSSFLAVQLSRPAGRKFMRKIAAQPGGFARLDRLSTISGGQTLVKQLIRDKGGEVFMEYLATTDGGRRLGQQAAAAQRGVDLNKPTGRIYTVDDLIGELRRAWEKGGKATVDR